MSSKSRPVVASLLVASVLLAACGQAATPEPTQVPPPAPAETEAPVPTVEPTADPLAMYAPAAVSGPIISAGSSTVFPLSEAMAELFYDEGYADQVTIDSIGSGAGFERFCVAGESDISNASRRIKDSELESCRGIGREPIEFRVGTDAMAFTVSRENTFLTNVTVEQLAQIFGPAENWSDVDPSWPDEPILRFSPGTDSGTFDYFVEAVMAPAFNDTATDVNEGEETILGASNLQLSEDDNVLVQGVEGSPYAIGYFGYAYYQENSDRLNIVSVEGVTPSGETVDNGTYPLARPLFIYSTAEIMQEKPQVAAFIYFYLTRVNDIIGDVGYFPTTQDVLDAGVQAWMEAMGLGM